MNINIPRTIKIFLIFLIITGIFLTILLLIFPKNTSHNGNKGDSITSQAANYIVTIKTKLKEITLNIELARSEKEKAQGLMNRTSLPENNGMLFIFDNEQIRTFWMKDTLISLDMIFINKEGEIVTIAKNTKINQTQETYSSSAPSKYVLEVNAGWCDKNGVTLGDLIILLILPDNI
jgi:hypothetical protein